MVTQQSDIRDAEGAPQKIEVGTPAFIRTNLALFTAGLATFALLYSVQPLLPAFSDQFHVSATTASLSLSLTTAFLAVSMLVAGAFSESWGRKPMMVASLLLSSLLALVSAVLPHWGTFLVVRALMGVALSGLPAVAMAYVGEEMHPRSLNLAMGLYVGGTGLGGMSGRLLVGVITDFWGWRTALLSIGVLGLVCALILWRCLPASRHFVRSPLSLRGLSRTYASHLRDSALPWLFAEAFMLMGGFVTIYNYVGYRLMAAPFFLSQSQIGLIFAVYLLGVFSSAWTGVLAARFGRPTMLPIAFVLMLVGTLLTCAGSLWVIITGIAILTVGFFSTHSIASAWVGARAKVGRAQATSLYLFAYYLGSSVVGSLGGVFWSHDGWNGVTTMTGVLLLVALGVAWKLRRPDTSSPAISASRSCAS